VSPYAGKGSTGIARLLAALLTPRRRGLSICQQCQKLRIELATQRGAALVTLETTHCPVLEAVREHEFARPALNTKLNLADRTDHQRPHKAPCSREEVAQLMLAPTVLHP